MRGSAPILLVEDDLDIRETILEVLADAGYAARGAIDGIDALQQLHRVDPTPGLILLDLMMPRMSGLELCAELAKVEAWSRIPVVVLTADAEARAKAESVGAAAYLRKPLHLADLLRLVAENQHRGSSVGKSEAPGVPPTSPP